MLSSSSSSSSSDSDSESDSSLLSSSLSSSDSLASALGMLEGPGGAAVELATVLVMEERGILVETEVSDAGAGVDVGAGKALLKRMNGNSTREWDGGY